ncbi:ABC transporter permease [Akkermansiaceae bacterium]|nr:ABC transporter permease [Akkermansiaceae bacterium]
MNSDKADRSIPPRAVWESAGGVLSLTLAGDWMAGGKPEITGDAVGAWPDEIKAERLGSFDSTLPAYLLGKLRESGVKEPVFDGLPENLRKLLELATKVPERSEAKSRGAAPHGLGRLGAGASAAWGALLAMLEFVGDAVLAMLRFFTGRARFRSGDFWAVVQDCGVDALPIVALISFLIGMILAFVGNVQLASFGASLYVADLVGIAMVREMGVMMTAIIMSGRTGASFAAHIGSMNANQEIDALKTFGFNPFDYLVLPRLFALVLMMPILTVYSNVIGILGGMLVAAWVGIPPQLFWTEMLTTVDLTQASLGVFKSVFFGAAIAISGCMQGMNSGSSSSAVGQATTRAVVASITSVIILDSAFAVIFTLLDI